MAPTTAFGTATIFMVAVTTTMMCALTATATEQDTISVHTAVHDECDGRAGLSWCEAKKKCLKVWEEACPALGGEMRHRGSRGHTCTMANCSWHAIAVKGNSKRRCFCTCRNMWAGHECQDCPNKYNPAVDCGACAQGYTGEYPDCIAKPATGSPGGVPCTNSLDCSGHAISVSGKTDTGCTCMCRNRWMGAQCQKCPPNFNPQQDCGTCAAGFSNFPECSPVYATCTITDNCNGHATSVSGNTATGCTCTCRNQWTGASCASCAAKYSPSNDCDACAPGLSSYPNCYQLCTILNNCSNHAFSVTGNSHTGCACSCSNSWTGTKCETCPANFNAANDCGSCAAGFGGYPACTAITSACTNAANCNSHAISVTGNVNTGCSCACRNMWQGAQCQTCPSQYDANSDCGACAIGYSGSFPACSRSCTVAGDCSGHAISVNGDSHTGCSCVCLGAWVGAQCQTCPSNFNGQMCDRCAIGFTGYPTCNPATATPNPTSNGACTMANCNNHAISVSGNVATGCSCTCRNQWEGAQCQTCPSKYSTAEDCALCANGHVNYPSCYRVCTNTGNCNGNAASVSGDYHSGCTCSCSNAWTGSQCQTCPSNFNSAQDCGLCASGYSNYPVCSVTTNVCSNLANCNGHATSVTGHVSTGCACTCRNSWTGDSCGLCPVNFVASTDCAMCAPGFDSYPGCYRTCTNTLDCSSHATTVTGNVHTGCTCSCRNQWQGANCDMCAAKFDANQDCGACAAGHSNYPTCTATSGACTVANDCNGNAISVTGNVATGCTCSCRNQWSGASCGTCQSKFLRSADCGTCAPGYDTFPSCYLTCTLAANCTGSHATMVTGNTNTGCSCTCNNQWSGTKCQTCPSNFNAFNDCASCASGFMEYPLCVSL